jgi:deazaflavin-dependent oxidoreductase (nitroreductase family)
MIDWMDLMHRQHTVHALLEVDVTDARQAIRQSRAGTREPLSFTAFVVASLACAVAEDKRMQAYRKGRRHLLLFDDVDVAVAVERELEGEKVPVGFVVRAADKKAVTDIHQEIRSAQAEPAPWSGAVRWLPLWLLFPAPIRRFLWAMFLGDPRRRKRLSGTVVVTSVGTFGSGMGWGIPLTDYTLCLTVGGIARKPGVARDRAGEERIEIREFLSLTISFNHDVVDGAPAARFAARLKEIIESGTILAKRREEAEQRRGRQPYIRPSFFMTHIFNPINRRLGLFPTLTVRGRRSGELRTIPLGLPLEYGGARYLVSGRGATQWVRNLRAAGHGELRIGRVTEKFRAVEIDGAERD